MFQYQYSGTLRKAKIQLNFFFSYGMARKLGLFKQGGFRRTNPEAAALTGFYTKSKEENLMLALGIQGRKFEGIFDSDADVVSLSIWPTNWALEDIQSSLERL